MPKPQNKRRIPSARPDIRRAPAGKGTAARHGGHAPARRKAAGRTAKAWLITLLCLVLVAAVVLGLWLWGGLGQPAAVSSLPPASASAPVVSSSVPVAPSVAPSSIPASSDAQPWPLFSLEAAQVDALNAMLDTWADEETYVKKTTDEDGQSLAEPVTIAAGGHNVSVWFLDLESGAQYSYNAEHSFYYASMMKAPYAAWLYLLAEQEKCDLEQVVTVQPQQVNGYEGNTGVLKEMPLPADFTVEQLIGYLLRDSDTVALKVLLELYPAEGFVQWAEELGLADAAALHSVIYGRVTSADAGILLMAMADIMQNGEYGPRLREHMENSRNKMITSQYPVARKYGWDTEAYHDMAVVFAPRPYLLVIMTDKWGGSWAEQQMFGTIAAELEAAAADAWAGYSVP